MAKRLFLRLQGKARSTQLHFWFKLGLNLT